MEETKGLKTWAYWAGAMIITVINAVTMINSLSEERNYSKARENAMAKYADYNHDGPISIDEKIRFDSEMFGQLESNVFYDAKKGILLDVNGDKISKKVLSEWYNSFEPRDD